MSIFLLIDALFLILIALSIFFSKNILTDILSLGIFSLLMAVLYTLMNAPDVAITEAAVGTFLSTIFALIALLSYTFEAVKNKNNLFIGVISAIVMGTCLFLLIPHFPEFGDINSPANNHITNYYIYNTMTKLGFTNIVTGILASFRGFDTFIETIVIFTAATAVYMLIGKNENNK